MMEQTSNFFFMYSTSRKYYLFIKNERFKVGENALSLMDIFINGTSTGYARTKPSRAAYVCVELNSPMGT